MFIHDSSHRWHKTYECYHFITTVNDNNNILIMLLIIMVIIIIIMIIMIIMFTITITIIILVIIIMIDSAITTTTRDVWRVIDANTWTCHLLLGRGLRDLGTSQGVYRGFPVMRVTLLWRASFDVVMLLVVKFTFGEFSERLIHSFRNLTQMKISQRLKKLLRDIFEK